MEDVAVPLFYVLNRRLPETEADAVMRALQLTPVFHAIVSNLLDTHLAFAFAPGVQHVNSDEDALLLAQKLAEDTGRPMLVIGEADFLDAVYVNADGTLRREALVKHA